MKPWGIGACAVVVALGCSSEATQGAGPNVGSALGVPLPDQHTALNYWWMEMWQGDRTMREDVAMRRDRGTVSAEGAARFGEASQAYREAWTTAAANPMAPADPSLTGDDAAIAGYYALVTTVLAPSYCRVLDAYRATTGTAYPEPRVRCSELPDPPRWWTRWP